MKKIVLHSFLIGLSLAVSVNAVAQKKAGNYIEYDAEDKGSLTAGNLSVGKFYRFSRKPDAAYLDTLACRWSDGARLTDEVVAADGKNLLRDHYVGWTGNKPVEITIDLGRAQLLQKLNLHGLVSQQANALLPTAVEVYTKAGKDDKWQLFSKRSDLGKLAQKEVSYGYTIDIAGKEVTSRYVKLTFTPSTKGAKTSTLLLDEVNLLGKIKNTWRYVPKNGSFHGAFPTHNGYPKEQLAGRKGMVVDIFEKEVGKKVSMVLWYQKMTAGRNFAEIQAYRDKFLHENYDGNRFLSIGWLPTELKPIADGGYDEFFTQYFKDSVDPAILKGIKDPIWLRPMNEFNGGWVPYGLKPDLFRKAWRRMYNIAEQLGAAEQHIFVWSPNYLSFPDKPWNKMEKYYPGDQYVDWVGLSSYPPSEKAAKNNDMRYPLENIAEAYNLYAHYKPFMISEGGFSKDIDPVRWVKEWFEFKTKRPLVKAVIWENHNDRVIALSPEALDLYKKMVQDDYWLGENQRKSETEKKKK
jgi:hypothetical protein